ncbi:MAG: hypothetical protein CMF23_18130 [Ignavibacteriae bacterium]|nr:hypothetical protein [Ignavibacteriota bacterium]
MNFIVEFSENDKTIKDEYLELRITKTALDLANLLLELEDETFNEIEKIIFVNNSKMKNEKIETILRKFTLRFELFYTHNQQKAKQLVYLFPESDKVNEKYSKANKIDRLIKESFTQSINEVFKKEEFIGFYDYAKDIIDDKKLKMSKIVYKGKDSKIKTINQYEVIEAKRYYEIRDKINKLPKEPKDPMEAYEYTHKPFFNHLEKGYVGKLESLIIGKDSRAFIYGEDNFIAVKSKDYIFNGKDEYYDLRRGIPFLEKSNNNIALNFIHQLSPNKFNDLRKRLIPLLDGSKILFLGEELDLDNSLGIYCNSIPIPNSSKIQEVITKLFIALLREERILSGKMSFIYEVINSNSFKIFFEETETLNEIYEAIKQIDEITTEDLLTNQFFWIKFLELLESQQNKHRVKAEAPKNTLSMIFENGEWVMIFNDDELIRSNKTFMIYLDIIIQHQIRFNSSIDVVKLRKGAIKYQKKILKLNPKGNIDELDEESCRKTVGKALKDFQDDFEERIKFIEEFIKYNKYEYTFYTRNIKLQEIISPIDDNFFDDLD